MGLAVGYLAGLAISYQMGLKVSYLVGLAVTYVVGLAISYQMGLAISYQMGLAVGYLVGLAVSYLIGLAVSCLVGLAVTYLVGLAVISLARSFAPNLCMSSNGTGKTWGWEGLFADVISTKISGSNTNMFFFPGKLLVQPMSIRFLAQASRLQIRLCIGKLFSSFLNQKYVVRTQLFSLFLNQKYVVHTQKNCLDETILLSTKNTFKLMGKKIIAILRS